MDFPLYFEKVMLLWQGSIVEIDYGLFRVFGPYFIGKSLDIWTLVIYPSPLFLAHFLDFSKNLKSVPRTLSRSILLSFLRVRTLPRSISWSISGVRTLPRSFSRSISVSPNIDPTITQSVQTVKVYLLLLLCMYVKLTVPPLNSETEWSDQILMSLNSKNKRGEKTLSSFNFFYDFMHFLGIAY